MATRKNFLFLGGKDRITPLPSSSLQFEFDEAETWCNNTSSNENVVHNSEAKISIPNSKFLKKPGKKSERSRAISSTSLPVNIPNWSKILGDEYRSCPKEIDDNNVVEDFDYESGIPPHEYLARTRVASFSVHEGIGRTLKGRDLSRVRNAIWKQTGFED
ncbi:protein S40-4-like [Nicotiana tabacum]|uniref:Protein S40-4-like n=1 Tax=Nicotiana tabacum TaxID=4097 RepID=A0A1S3X4P3_TOBAC|nr:PREDICTED: uncharacterized protein LOC107761182 [Nicotiana tabacum]